MAVVVADSIENRQSSWLPIIIVLVVIVLWLANLLFLAGHENRGTFGDMFDAVNALFTGLAFAGVIYAIFLQRQELELQRRELELTRVELSGQREALTNQNLTMERQNFESTFFQLLRLHNDILGSMDIPARKRRT